MIVYFLRHPENRLVKIGRSSRLSVRLRQLNYEFNTRFEVLGVVSEERFAEVHLHRLFRKLRETREFFLPDPVLLRFIREHAQPWDLSWDAPGGEVPVKLDRHVRYQLKCVAEERGVSLESLVDELLRTKAQEMYSGHYQHSETRP